MASQEQVNQVADALAAENRKVTVASVREALGGGSFSTLSPMVKAWREQHVAETAAAEELPDEAQEAGLRAARTIWGAAMAHAKERIDLAQQQAEQRVSVAEAGQSEAVEEIRRLEEQVGTLSDKLEEVTTERDELAGKVREHEATMASLREQLSEQRDTVEGLREKLTALREAHAAEKARLEARLEAHVREAGKEKRDEA